MHFLLDLVVTLISLVFLSIVGFVAGVAIPGLFLPVAAALLDWLLPSRRQRA